MKIRNSVGHWIIFAGLACMVVAGTALAQQTSSRARPRSAAQTAQQSSPKVATAGNGGVHGGNSCSQSVPILRDQLMAELTKICGNNPWYPCSYFPLPEKKYAGQTVDSNNKRWLNLGALDWFMVLTAVDVVPNVYVNGVETEASNDPSAKRIELSRNLWCPLSDIEKMSVLFHEYLGTMEIEGDNEYPVSRSFVPGYEWIHSHQQ